MKMRSESGLDLVYYGAAIALIGVALYFTDASEGKAGERIGRAAGARARHGAAGTSPGWPTTNTARHR